MKKGKVKCKKRVPSPGMWMHDHQCTRYAVKDGFCKIHHPDAQKKRDEEAHKRQEEKWDNSPHQKLARALDKNSKLELTIKRLRNKIVKLELELQEAQNTDWE